MARTLRAAAVITNAGVAAALTAVDATAAPNGEYTPYGAGHKVLHVKTGGTVVTVTISDDEGFPVPAPRSVVVCPATGDTYILLQVNPQSGALQGGGNISINYSVATTCTAEILDVGATA